MGRESLSSLSAFLRTGKYGRSPEMNSWKRIPVHGEPLKAGICETEKNRGDWMTITIRMSKTLSSLHRTIEPKDAAVRPEL